jgi:uncharacterized damage-inducible protein DinB
VVLSALLRGVTQERALQATDGPDGWNLVYILSHMRDYEPIYHARIQLILEKNCPEFPRTNNDEMIRVNDYAHQDLREAFAAYVEGRRAFVRFLDGLTEEQWTRRGIHATYGEGTALEMVMNTVVHDINHLEQIARVLGLSEAVL